MPFLIDTNVISELRDPRRCHSNVIAWQTTVLRVECYVSVITLMEIRHGILKARRRDAVFAGVLENWYTDQVKRAFEERVIPVDLAVAERCSLLLGERSRGLGDALIAATAYVNNLTLVTRNIADFADSGVKLLNPWEASQS